MGSGFENHSKYGGAIYSHGSDDRSLFVNLYIPSVLTWKEKGLKGNRLSGEWTGDVESGRGGTSAFGFESALSGVGRRRDRGESKRYKAESNIQTGIFHYAGTEMESRRPDRIEYTDESLYEGNAG